MSTQLRKMTAPAFLALLITGGCSALSMENTGPAIDAVVNHARFDLECPDVQATVDSQEAVKTSQFIGSEHTITASGCGRQAVYVTHCRAEGSCEVVSKTGRQKFAPQIVP